MFGSIKYNLSHLLDFNGRDARQTFWFYVLFLVIVQFVVGLVAAGPMMGAAIGTAFEAAQKGVTDQAAIQAQVSARMGGAVGGVVWVSVTTKALMALLLVAAFVRRLHDSDKSGWWAMLAVAGQAVSLFIAIRVAGQIPAMMAEFSQPEHMQEFMQRQAEMARYSLIGWVAPLTVIVFGVMKSTDGPNRFGDTPVSF